MDSLKVMVCVWRMSQAHLVWTGIWCFPPTATTFEVAVVVVVVVVKLALRTLGWDVSVEASCCVADDQIRQ
jgi:hypothetical protein